MADPYTFLGKAMQIAGDRYERYGDAAPLFDRVAGLWSEYLELPVPLTGEAVATMMILFKVVRREDSQTPSPDDLLDIAGYANVIAMMEQERDTPDIS